MFTGLVTNKAQVLAWMPKAKGGRLMLGLAQSYRQVKMGESIAVNGCCLTVVEQKSKRIAFDVSDETMRKTAFGSLKVGQTVNLERALQAQDRLGGHFVLGHVDTVGKIKSVKRAPGSIIYSVSYPKKFRRLVIEKGSVAIDGISLTACDVKPGSFNVYIIPHTLKETNLGERHSGDAINVEFDVLGKYILNR